jgi:hypothetical protein
MANKEICRECLEKEGIIPTKKTTNSSFGLNKYEEERGIGVVVKWIKKVFG